jgi:orotate phosphoribosyltransferase
MLPLPVLQVDLLVGDVDVAAEDELAFALERIQVREEALEEAELGSLAFLAGRAAREVAADDRQLARRRVEAQFEVAAFGIELGVAPAHHHLARGVLGVNRSTGVALLLRKMEVALEACHLFEAAFDVAGLDLDLLHANTIRRQFGHPVGHALGGGRAQAIEVEAGQFEQKEFPMAEVKGAGDRLALDFVQFALDAGVLRFGEFKTKAGRLSPYFFNAGLFDDGAKMLRLAEFYAERLIDSGLEFDMLFGPAYKGIPLGAVLAAELARRGRNVPFAYNRKEAKAHGEGGSLVGAKLQGRVLIVDDVMSAGTAVRESIATIRQAGATPHAVAIALDRQEMATEDGVDVAHSAVQYVQNQLGMQVLSIASLDDLLKYLAERGGGELDAHRDKVLAYRQRYGAA